MSEFWERLKHELSVAGVSAHLHKREPDEDLVEELLNMLRDEQRRSQSLTNELQSLRQRVVVETEDASRCVAGVDAVVRQTKANLQHLERDNSLLREQLLRIAEDLQNMTNERNQLAVLSELNLTNEELVATQTAQLDELRRQLKEAHDQMSDHDRLRMQLNGADERIRALDAALSNYVAEIAELRRRSDDDETTLDDARRKHAATLERLRVDYERTIAELTQQSDELRGAYRLSQAAANECSQRFADLQARHDTLQRELNAARSSLNVIPIAQADVRSAESELNDAYKRLELSERDRQQLLSIVRECEINLTDVHDALNSIEQKNSVEKESIRKEFDAKLLDVATKLEHAESQLRQKQLEFSNRQLEFQNSLRQLESERDTLLKYVAHYEVLLQPTK